MQKRTRWTVLILSAILLLTGNSSGTGGTAETPATRFARAYQTMASADWLNERGMTNDAADLYTEAMQLFGQLGAEHPQWQTDVVNFRIAYCQNALTKLVGAPALRVDSAMQKTPAIPEHTAAPVPPQPEPTLPERLQDALRLEQSGDLRQALDVYITVMNAARGNRPALQGAMRCCLRLKLFQMARQLEKQAAALPNPDAEAMYLKAVILCMDGQYNAAINQLNQTLKLKPDYQEAYIALGAALAAVGKNEQAENTIKRGIVLNPKCGDAYYNLARMAMKKQSFPIPVARTHYENALRNGAEPDPELDALLEPNVRRAHTSRQARSIPLRPGQAVH